MILLTTFERIDHPLIIIAQTITAFYLFRLFFVIRKSPWPLPQIGAGLAFGVLANVVARANHEEWFWRTDIVQFVTLAAVVIASVHAAQRNRTEAAKLPGAVVIVSDFFDRIETKVTWGIGLALAGMLTFYCINLYMDVQHKDAELVVAAEKATAKATVQFSEQLCKTEQAQNTQIQAMTSFSATLGTVIANQRKNSTAILNGQKDVKQTVLTQNQKVKKTIENSVIQARPLETTKPKIEEKEEKQNIFKRFKNLFHSSARRDSLSSDAGVMPSDTLVYQ